MAELFSDYLKRSARPFFKSEGINAQKWIGSMARSLDKVEDKVLADRPRDLSIGSMYLFVYDAKLKETLPYWDIHPLIFPISVSGDRFMGLNLHYLPPVLRARLMDSLYDFASDDPAKPNTDLDITYGILKGVAKYRYFKPCVHVYLNQHVRSRFMWISALEWKKALLMPLQRFTGPHAGRVYTDSMRKA